MNATSPPTNVRETMFRLRQFKLRDRLFLASALLSTTILLIAAWVINNQVVRQARQQIRSVAESMLPVYNAVWDEHARGLATLGTTIASSPSVKIIFGDERASRDRETIREMIADFGSDPTSRVDLILITDGAGKITFAEIRGAEITSPDDLPPAGDFLAGELGAARIVAENQQQQQAFAMLGTRLYQLALTPILVQSANAEYQNTFAVLGTGLEISRAVAEEIKQRTGSEVIFLTDNQIYASSLGAEIETQAAQEILASDISRVDSGRPVELRVDGQLHVAFSRQISGFDGLRVGQVVMLRSLAEAGRLFRSISNVLLILWTLSIGAAFMFSYLIAQRITRPMEALMTGTREYGRGNYDYEIRADAQGDLGELAGAFNQMRRSLKQTQSELLRRERLATVGQMAGSIVHDLRNPLATIATAAEMLARHNLSSERQQTLLESQLRASQRMREMLQELLDFSRGNASLTLSRHALGSVIENVVQELNALAMRSGVVMECHIADDLFVSADVEQLGRVFENLLMNAIQAMPDGGRLFITALRQEKFVRVDVRDTGPGIPPQIQERLFEPFVSYGKPGGTGLGLAIAQNIIHAHGGDIGLEAGSGQRAADRAQGGVSDESPHDLPGAHFFVTLPLEKS